MSVIVKGMEMPENCWECVRTDLNIAISVFGGMCPFCEKIRTDHDMQTGRHPECPLGALPEKHGRLVDADTIVNAMNDMNVGGEVFVTAVEYVKLIMNDADTIVEAEDRE